jgi:hypothetical protein
MTQWWVHREGGPSSGTPIIYASMAMNDETTEGPLDEATDAELTAFLNPPPASVSRMQAMVALNNAGLLTQVQAWVAAQDATTQLIWSNAQTFSRQSELLGRAAAALNLTSAQVDQLFVSAAAVNP